MIRVIDGGTITDVKGVNAVGIVGKLKKSGKKDLALIYCKDGAISAGAFTTNLVKASPVIFNMENVKNPITKAIICNSGNANACNGEEGMQNTLKMAERVAENLGINKEEIFVNSTGVIGKQLDMEKIIPAIDEICEDIENKFDGNSAAEAIQTTDSFEKEFCVEIEIGTKTVTIAGIAKGSGMIHPNMATMLSFLATDVNISKELLVEAYKLSVVDSYNMISVDGDTSTNDTSLILATGKAGNTLIDTKNADYEKFKEALDFVNTELAKLIAKDGEGATKLIEVDVLNAKTKDDARKCAKSIISSNLTKCAFFGADANWGRILCAMGYSGGNFDPLKVDLKFKSRVGEIEVFKNGTPLNFDEEIAKKVLLEEEIRAIVDLKDGEERATAWGCDLSYDYVKINGSYRS